MSAVQGDVVAPLSRYELALLRFSARLGMTSTPFEAMQLATWEAFGVGVLRFRQQLAVVIQHPAAAAAEPAEVRRLRRLLDRRASRRGAHPGTTHPGGTT